jgi:hypothetical protein
MPAIMPAMHIRKKDAVYTPDTIEYTSRERYDKNGEKKR